MRAILACVVASTMFPVVARVKDSGVPPRDAATDYPVQGRANTAVIAAAIVPPKQVSRMFSPEVGKRYVVVEVAIYPEGVPFDVESANFALRVGKRVGRADRPLDVAPWPEGYGTPRRSPVDVTTEAGIIYESGNDPVYGRRQGVGTYTGVGVGVPGRDDVPPPPDPQIDPRAVYDKVQRMALPEGDTRRAIAGYLYFPQYAKRKKSDPIELKYARDDVSVDLLLGKP
jgi:hypothetical protein